MSVGANYGKFEGKGQVTRKDGTVEPFYINTNATQEQADNITKMMQKNESDSQEQTKSESNT